MKININKLEDRVDVTINNGKFYKTLNFNSNEFNRLSTLIYELNSIFV